MKKNKIKLPFSFPSLRIKFDKWTVIKLAAALAAIGALIYGYNQLKGLEYFRVKEIVLRQGSSITLEENRDFAYLKGRNIFTIDLAREALNVSRAYPNYKKVWITRFLPDRLFVDFLQRKPLACIKASRIFYVDENMVLFEKPPVPAPEAVDLPLISGIESKLFGAKYGRRMEAEGLSLALKIIKAAGSIPALKNYRISRVDVASLNNTAIFILVPAVKSDYTKEKNSAYFSREMEVKVGQDNIAGKLSLLANLLVQVRNNLSNITYIDLRFQEPVIKFRERM